jgi:putative ABC transport system substrate-binding protein
VNRRETIIGFAALCVAARPIDAQQRVKFARVGYLASDLAHGLTQLTDVFRQGLREHGYVEGGNLVIEYRDAKGKLERLPALANELAALKVDVIFAPASQQALAAKQATTTIPIVFADVDDPVARGLVTSLARPGGNITGFCNLNTDLVGKCLELLKQALHRLNQVTLLWQPGYLPQRAKDDIRKQAESAAQALGVRLDIVSVEISDDLDRSFSYIANAGTDAVIVWGGSMMILERRRVTALAATNRLPATIR